jgi:hypothetical protein
MIPSDQQVIFTRLDFNVRFRQTGKVVEVEEFDSESEKWGWVTVGRYFSRAKTPGGLMHSASRWLAQNRWEQLELPMPEEETK